MELLSPACFVPLSSPQRLEQLYLAYGGTQCFTGRSRTEQFRMLAEQIGIDACIYSEVDFYRAWLWFLDPTACSDQALDALQGAVYALLYAQAGDTSLVSPACFYGLSPDLREFAILAASGGSAPDVPPTLTSATVDASTLTLVFSKTVFAGTGDNSSFDLFAVGGLVTMAYASGTGTDTLVYNLSRPVWPYDTLLLNYTQPGGGVEDLAGNDLVTFSDFAVTNNSTYAVDPLRWGNAIRWYNADDLTPGAVAAWPDSLGIGPDIVQATSANQPVATASVYNGRQGVLFDGDNDKLQSTDAGMPTGDLTIVALVKCTQATFAANNYGVISHYGLEDSARCVDLLFVAPGIDASGSGVGLFTYAMWQSYPDQTQKWVVVTVQKKSGVWTLRIGRDKGRTVGGTTATTLSGHFIMGAWDTTTDGLAVNSNFPGYIRHWIMYDEYLDEDSVYGLIDDLLREGEDPHVLNVTTAGNDGTGSRTSGAPYATINAALDAALPGDTIQIGVGTFAPVDPTKAKARIEFRGSGRPDYDDPDTPTQLVGGTIIQGPFTYEDKADFKAYDLGIDSGSAVCTALYSGAEQEGFLLHAIATHPEVALNLPKPGVIVRNVISLIKDASALKHCMLFENMWRPQVSNLKTWGGFAGAVFKTTNAVVSNLQLGPHGDALYFKAGLYSFCYGNVVSGTNTIDGAGVGRGMTFVRESGEDIYGLNISGLTIDNCITGIHCGDFSGNLLDTTISATVTNSTDEGVSLDHANNVTFTGSVSNSGSDGVLIDSTCTDVHLVSLVVSNNGGYGVNNGSTTTTGDGEVTGSGNALGLIGGNALL